MQDSILLDLINIKSGVFLDREIELKAKATDVYSLTSLFVGVFTVEIPDYLYK